MSKSANAPCSWARLNSICDGMDPDYPQVRNAIAELGPPLIATIYLLFREWETRREAKQ
jgi:hypothetical protein